MISEGLKCSSSLTKLNLSGDEMKRTETKRIEMKQINREPRWSERSRDDKRSTEM